VRVLSVDFVGAIGQIGQAPPDSVLELPRVAFSGRSNVGKSSLVNRLLGRTRSPIARVSAQPGKTQEINFYQVRTDAGEFVLVDLPGYGYARVPFGMKEKWGQVIESYLRGPHPPNGVVQLIDLRHGPSPDDLRSVEFLAELGLPVLFALTKADKLKPSQRAAAVAKSLAALGADPDQAIACSARTGDGREELLESLGALLGLEDGAPDAGQAPPPPPETPGGEA
jgi:GTP-binding protein